MSYLMGHGPFLNNKKKLTKVNLIFRNKLTSFLTEIVHLNPHAFTFLHRNISIL